MTWTGPCETLIPIPGGRELYHVRHHHPFGQALYRFVHHPSVIGLLPDGTWVAGGCWLLARVLQTFLRQGTLQMVTSQLPNGDCGVQHVVLRIGAFVLDGGGVATEAEFLTRLRLTEPAGTYVAPRLEAYDPAALRAGGLAEYPDLQDPLLDRFCRRFPRDAALWHALGVAPPTPTVRRAR